VEYSTCMSTFEDAASSMGSGSHSAHYICGFSCSLILNGRCLHMNSETLTIGMKYCKKTTTESDRVSSRNFIFCMAVRSWQKGYV
jgi:hypothetical protein